MLFSIVRNVDPGALCSYRRGRTEVAFFGDRQSAQSYADLCQFHHAVRGMVYTVEQFTEDHDPGRAPNEMMRRETEGVQ